MRHRHHKAHPHHPHSAWHPLSKAAAAFNQNNTAFLEQAIKAAQASETATGVPASIIIAQAIIESGWGHHHCGVANNYFGIKAPESAPKSGKYSIGRIATGYVIAWTEEWEGGARVKKQQPFRTYMSMTDSFLDHGEWVRANHHYVTALKDYARTGNADAFAHALQVGHYAGALPGYDTAVIKFMKSRNLYQYNSPLNIAAEK